MQKIEDSIAQSASEQFGMTDEEVKSYQVKNLLGKITYYFSRIEPTVVRILNTIVYWTIKIIKSFVKSVVRMILGKEI